jgi:hypothetical protein
VTLTALLQTFGDGQAVLGGLVVVELELGQDVDDVQAKPTDAGQQPPVRRSVDLDRRVVVLRLQRQQLPAQQLRLVGRIVDDLGSAAQLDCGVVARRHTLTSGTVRRCAPGVRYVGVVVDHGEHDPRLRLDQVPHRVGPGQVHQHGPLVVDGEVGGHHRRPASRVVHDELPEVATGGQPGPPLVVARGVPRVHHHERSVLLQTYAWLCSYDDLC